MGLRTGVSSCHYQCVIKAWNSLPREVMEADNLARSKKGLNTFLEERDLGSY